MAALTYPASLPGPMPGSFAPRPRRAASSIEGPLQQRARQRDGAGAMHQYTYVYTPAEMVVWRTWWRDELLEGKSWFRARLPGRGGMMERWARYVTTTEQLLGGGIYRVQASIELRGLQLCSAALAGRRLTMPTYLPPRRGISHSTAIQWTEQS